MRARDFVAEANGNARITKRQQSGTRGLNTFSDGERRNNDYTLNRVMMAVAATDGTFVPELDMKSWAGKDKTAHPYTQQEQDMLKMAYQAAGARYQDVNGGDMNSEEPPGGNVQSPIQGFKGYPR
jgi:hypothetical protein